jgi:TctA family transporter
MPPGQHRYSHDHPYGQAPATTDGLGVAALVLGIVGILLSAAVIGIVPAILALIFGIIVRKRARYGIASNGGHALAGIIMGIVGIVMSIALLSVYIVAGVNESHCEQLAANQFQRSQCDN